MYYDTYLGGEQFAGEKAVWIDGNPYWRMNYIGRVTGENSSGEFLKEALLNVPFEKPFRGPEKYQVDNYEYMCFVNGNFDWFQGKEIISFCGNEIYECYFYGVRHFMHIRTFLLFQLLGSDYCFLLPLHIDSVSISSKLLIINKF